MRQAWISEGSGEEDGRRPFDPMDVSEVEVLHAVRTNQCLHQDLEAKDREIEKLKMAAEEASRQHQMSRPKPIKPIKPLDQVVETARLYAFTMNAYFNSCLFRISLDAEWVPEKRWDKEFIEQGHLHEFRDWPQLPDTIRTQISLHPFQKMV